MFVVKLTVMENICHQFIYPDLLVDSFYHDLFVYRLVISSDKVTIKIHIQIIHFLHKRKRLKRKDVVHIECMLRKLHSTFMQKFGTVNDRMHQKVFTLRHMHAVPSENLIYRQTMTVLHNFLAGCPLLLINKIADQHIHGLRSTNEFPQCVQNLCVGFFIYPVIAVYDLEIKACGIADTGIDSFSVSAIFLMDSLYDRRIFLCICIGNLCCTVRRSIIHYKDFHILSALQKRLDTFFHICF